MPEGSPLCFHMNDGYDYCSTTAERTECGKAGAFIRALTLALQDTPTRVSTKKHARRVAAAGMTARQRTDRRASIAILSTTKRSALQTRIAFPAVNPPTKISAANRRVHLQGMPRRRKISARGWDVVGHRRRRQTRPGASRCLLQRT